MMVGIPWRILEMSKGLPKYLGQNLRRCRAMIDAGIANPNSQEGIGFCTESCPFDKCELFEGGESIKVQLRMREARLMQSQGMTKKKIAEYFKVAVSTIERDLREYSRRNT